MRIPRITLSNYNPGRYSSFGQYIHPGHKITQIDKIEDYDEDEEAARRADPDYPEGYFDRPRIHPQGRNYIPPEHPERYIFNKPPEITSENDDDDYYPDKSRGEAEAALEAVLTINSDQIY